jgi:hypothetical protein
MEDVQTSEVDVKISPPNVGTFYADRSLEDEQLKTAFA